jgi:hypothetical protein
MIGCSLLGEIGSTPIKNGDNFFCRAILWDPRHFFRVFPEKQRFRRRRSRRRESFAAGPISAAFPSRPPAVMKEPVANDSH